MAKMTRLIEAAKKLGMSLGDFEHAREQRALVTAQMHGAQGRMLPPESLAQAARGSSSLEHAWEKGFSLQEHYAGTAIKNLRSATIPAVAPVHFKPDGTEASPQGISMHVLQTRLGMPNDRWDDRHPDIVPDALNLVEQQTADKIVKRLTPKKDTPSTP